MFLLGNINLLSLSKEKLNNKYLCQEHFSPDDFMNLNKKKLKPTAIPYEYHSEKQPSTSAGKKL